MRDFSQFLTKIERLKADGAVDLSTAEDLSLAVMNLISLEEHFFFTGAKTGRHEYYDLSHEVREIRKDLMKRLLPATEGETWCASKHLLSATMRLVEVAQKLRSEGQREESDREFKRAYQVYSLFWALKLRLVEAREFKNRPAPAAPLSWEELVAKLADCCDE